MPSAQGRFGLAGAAMALEKPGGVPFGWRGLEEGGSIACWASTA